MLNRQSRALSTSLGTYPKKQSFAPLFVLGCSLIFYSLPAQSYALEFFGHSKEKTEEEYETNFNNVPVIDFIQLIAKIADLNFTYNPQELLFNVTITSEKPASVASMMSALAQILRLNGLMLVDDGNNILITSNPDIRHAYPLALAGEKAPGVPIATRIFFIKNAALASVFSVVKSFTSAQAIVEPISAQNVLVITDVISNIEQLEVLIKALDNTPSPFEVDSYAATYIPGKTLIASAQKILSPILAGRPLTLVQQSDSNLIFIISTPYLIERTKMLFKELDTDAAISVASENVMIYRPLFQPMYKLMTALDKLAAELKAMPNPPKLIIQAIRSAKPIDASSSILFIADGDTLNQIKDILAKLDMATSSQSSEMEYLIYPLQKASIEQISDSLEDLAKNLQKRGYPDPNVISTIENVKYIKSANTLVFVGSESSLVRIREILPTLDVSPEKIGGNYIPPSTAFLLYKPTNLAGDELMSAMLELSTNFEKSGLDDPSLLHVFQTMRYVDSTNTIVLTGDPDSLKKMQALLAQVDNPLSSESKVLFYRPKYVSKEYLLQELISYRKTLDQKADPRLYKAIDSVTWLDESNSFVFRADPETIERVQDILSRIDTEAGQGQYFFYKLQKAKGDAVIAQLKNFADHLPNNKKTDALKTAIQNIKWIPESNSLLITGTSQEITEIKEIIPNYDILGESALNVKTDFLIYKPHYQSPEIIAKILTDMGQELSAAGLADANLLSAISSAKYVPSTESLMFTGDADSLAKLQSIIATIDTPSTSQSGIYQVGPMSFLIYHLQKASPDEFLKAMRAFAKELDPSSLLNQEIAKSINGMTYFAENNSILFNGPQKVLEQINQLALKFDGPDGGSGNQSQTFVIYTPKYVNGQDLINILKDFRNTLEQSGVCDVALFRAINNLKWVPKTCSLIITSDPDTINKLEGLLERFDSPSKSGADIDALDNTSFLVYKLEYHQGADMMTAIKNIVSEMSTSSTGAGAQLSSAVQSLQWIATTNSLVGHGEPKVLGRLRELIASLDIPLRQVFIEILVLETTLTNSQTFGLQWGGNLKYLNKLNVGGGNFAAPNTYTQTSPLNLGSPISAVNATSYPGSGTGTSVPLTQPGTGGFDLGVIGDLIFHKGKTFFSLGSLVSALQTDVDATIILNPKIIAQDNSNSTIFVGQNIPFVGSVVNNTGNNATAVTTSLEYRDVGFNCSITPTLGSDNVVTLDINIDITNTTSNPNNQTTQTGQVNGILTTHTSLNTKVHVPDRSFLALSGLMQDTKVHFKSGIPCLGGLPVIGAIFSENDKLNSKDNIIMFVRPYIVNSYEEYKEITTNQEILYKQAAVLPVLKEEFDAGVNYIKKPEDE